MNYWGKATPSERSSWSAISGRQYCHRVRLTQSSHGSVLFVTATWPCRYRLPPRLHESDLRKPRETAGRRGIVAAERQAPCIWLRSCNARVAHPVKRTANDISRRCLVAVVTESLRALTAGKLMSREVVTIAAALPIRDAAHRLAIARVSGAPVVDESGRCVGVLSVSDIARW